MRTGHTGLVPNFASRPQRAITQQLSAVDIGWLCRESRVAPVGPRAEQEPHGWCVVLFAQGWATHHPPVGTEVRSLGLVPRRISKPSGALSPSVSAFIG